MLHTTRRMALAGAMALAALPGITGSAFAQGKTTISFAGVTFSGRRSDTFFTKFRQTAAR